MAGPHFALLAGPDGQRWVAAAASAGVPLRAHRVAWDGDVVDRDGAFAAAYGIGVGGAVVVRPDGVVGWRAADGREDAGEVLAGVMRRLVCR